MNSSRVQAIVNAVLYEGYMLYPYRPSSVKNRQRWTFGGVYPKDYSEAECGAEPWVMQTQCLLQARADTVLDISTGFLQLVQRRAGELLQPLRTWPPPAEPEYREVEVLEIGERRFTTWQEAMERQVALASVRLSELLASTRQVPFAFPGRNDLEPLYDAGGAAVGVLHRTQQPLEGRIELRAEPVAAGVFRLEVKIMNLTPIAGAGQLSRGTASLHALVSCHTILNVRNGEFVSSFDPPEALRGAAADCRNIGTWPVLAGVEGARDTLLSSPIILYDYPEIAPESPGDLFDATEIDEILTLRIPCLSDQEKREMAAVDDRARDLLERTERLAPEQLQKLHGSLRHLRPVDEHTDKLPRLASLRVAGVDLQLGDHVRLRPRARADIMDSVLAGKLATIEAIERDFEDRVHLAVTIDDDPGRDFGLERMPGHRFFFAPDEVELLGNNEVRAG